MWVDVGRWVGWWVGDKCNVPVKRLQQPHKHKMGGFQPNYHMNDRQSKALEQLRLDLRCYSEWVGGWVCGWLGCWVDAGGWLGGWVSRWVGAWLGW